MTDSNSNDSFDDKIKDIDSTIDDVLSGTPIEYKKVNDNIAFKNKLLKSPIKRKEVLIDTFGVDKVDLSEILKLNIWDRSILTTDAICKMFLRMNLEQLKKYIPKKPHKGFDYWWLIILLVVGGIAITVILLFLLPKLGGLKLF